MIDQYNITIWSKFYAIAEFFMHLDPECKSGYNKYASYPGYVNFISYTTII